MTIDTSITTIHALVRAKDRCKIKNIRSAQRNMTLALQRGKREADCTAQERSYLRDQSRDNCTAIAYNGFCYIVNKRNVCVTILPLPEWFGRNEYRSKRPRIREYEQEERSICVIH